MQRLLKYLNINTILLTLLASILGYGIISYYFQKSDPYEVPTGALPAPVQVSKNKLVASKTGDASMNTEYRRRRTIIGSNSGPVKKFGFSGSTNGSLETFFLSSIWPTRVIARPTDIFNGGNAFSNFCNILDGNGGDTLVDGGYSDTNVCGGVCTNVFEGGNAFTTFSRILDGNGGDTLVDGGNSTTNVCGEACTNVFEGGNAFSTFSRILNGTGGDTLVDGGYSTTNVCAT